MSLSCIICGRSETEVDKLFCFPRNKERLRVWQESLRMVYRGQMATHHRVCNLHFSESSFKPGVHPLRLCPDAVPINNQMLSVQDQVRKVAQMDIERPSTSQSNISSIPFVDGLNPELPTTPKTSRPSHSIGKGKRSIFKEISAICGQDMSPRKAKLVGVIKKKQMHIRKLKNKCKTKAATIRDLYHLDTSMEAANIFKGMPLSTVQFMISQIRCAKRSPYGRRWTLDDKIMSLAIYKRSPKCYALLRRLLALPSVRTLTLLLEKIPLEVGINKHIFEHLGKCLSEYPANDRLCILAFDEMAIREHMQYNPLTDRIEGVEDFGGGERTEKLANYALVFYIQGIVKPWKQPLAFYFSNGGASSSQIKFHLQKILDALADVNINIFCIVCDMGTANVKALKDLGSNISHPYITHNNQQIFTLFDFPHLLKCLRNLFKKYNVLVPITMAGQSEVLLQARWSDICKAYEEDKNNPLIFRSLIKLKDYYLAPLRQTAMKVKVAAQTMSRSVAVYLFNLVKQGILPSRALATATFVQEVDELFDSCNGSSLKHPDGKPYRCNVTENSGHVQFWQKAYEKVSQWRFIRKPEDETAACWWKPPSQNGWLHNLQALPQIWAKLKSMGIENLRTRALNQDGLENLFGAVRSGLGCNENPTASQFVSSLKTQIVNGLTSQGVKGANCEEDDGVLLSNLRKLFESGSDSTETKEPVSLSSPMNTSDDIMKDITEQVARGTVHSLSVAYVSGFLLKKIFKNFTCESCSQDLSSDDLEPYNYFISMKEFSDTSHKLFYPSEKLVVSVGHAITILEEYLTSLRSKVGIQKISEKLIKENVNFSWLQSCTKHNDFIKDCIVKGVCRIGIPWYCTRIVRDLRSKASQEASARKLKKLMHK